MLINRAKKFISNFRSKVSPNLNLVNFSLNILTFYAFVCLFVFLFPTTKGERKSPHSACIIRNPVPPKRCRAFHTDYVSTWVC